MKLMTETVTLALALAMLALPARSAPAGKAPRNFLIHANPKAIPEIQFRDSEGRKRTVADFKDKIVLLNVWATWCAPCRKEMPTLDRLQAQLGGPNFEVVALSIDRAGPNVVRRFYAEIGIKTLKLFIDQRARTLPKLRVVGLPSTLLIDRDGREIGRLIGPAEWDTAKMKSFFQNQINKTRP